LQDYLEAIRTGAVSIGATLDTDRVSAGIGENDRSSRLVFQGWGRVEAGNGPQNGAGRRVDDPQDKPRILAPLWGLQIRNQALPLRACHREFIDVATRIDRLPLDRVPNDDRGRHILWGAIDGNHLEEVGPGPPSNRVEPNASDARGGKTESARGLERDVARRPGDDVAGGRVIHLDDHSSSLTGV